VSDQGAPRTEPVVSFIIPALNASTLISEKLTALGAQDAGFQWEVPVVDNGSTDDKRAVVESFPDCLPALSVLECQRRGTIAARNVGAAAANVTDLLFCDTDDRFDGLVTTPPRRGPRRKAPLQ
jgi:glycosyltransferase involved in cell wall biosynthesis